jgi:hypothetical protein
MGGAAAWPLAARAQQAAMPVVGYLSTRGPDDDRYILASIRQGLKDVGFIERRNVAIEYRFAENPNDRLPALAGDLVRRQVAVIIAAPTRHWPPGPQLQRFRLSSRSGRTRSQSGLSRTSIDRAATSRVLATWPWKSCQSGWSTCASCGRSSRLRLGESTAHM